jgi:hypothetical protein
MCSGTPAEAAAGSVDDPAAGVAGDADDSPLCRIGGRCSLYPALCSRVCVLVVHTTAAL